MDGLHDALSLTPISSGAIAWAYAPSYSRIAWTLRVTRRICPRTFNNSALLRTSVKINNKNGLFLRNLYDWFEIYVTRYMITYRQALLVFKTNKLKLPTTKMSNIHRASSENYNCTMHMTSTTS